MKRLLTFIFLMLSVLTMRAGIFNTRNCQGIIHYTDGHQEACKEIKIPSSGHKKFTAVTESGEKKTIQALDVEYLELWHPKYPEKSRDVLWCCIDTKKDGTKKFITWSFVIAEGKYLSFYAYEPGSKYYMQENGLMMSIRSTSPGPTIIYIKPAVSGEYQVLGVQTVIYYASNKLCKKLAEKVISDDPNLCKAIQEKKWKGKVPELLEYVAGTYAPQK